MLDEFDGGHLGRRFAADVEGQSVRGGHFFPEQNPVETGHVLAKFFTRLRH